MKPFLLFLILVFSSIFFTSLTMPLTMDEPSFIGERQNVMLIKKASLELQENIQYFQSPIDFCYVSSGFFAIADNRTPAVILFDSTGKQIRVLGKRGNGPFEYIAPQLLHCADQEITVRDGRGFRINSFDINGEGAWGMVGVPVAMKSFVIFKKKLIYQHTHPHQDGYTVIFDMDDEVVSEVLGYKNSHDKLLSIYTHSGGLHIWNGVLYYARPSAPIVYIKDLNTGESDSLIIHDPDFRIADTQLTKNSNFEEVVEYITSNSRVVGIFGLNDFLVLQTEHGKEGVNRFSRLHILNDQHDLVDTISVPYDSEAFHSARRMAFSSGKHLFSYREEQKGDDFKRYMDIWEIQVLE